MKKILLSFLMILCLFCSCASKEVPAEITIIDENQEEVSYQITKTENLDEVKEVFNQLNKVKVNSKFNGASIDLKTELQGKVIITNQETRTIDLGYTLKLDATTNLKKYRMSGNLLLDGFTKTDSASLSFDTKNKLTIDFVNDDDFIYIKGSLEEDNNRLSLKNKVNIQEITNEYKTIITSSIDLMKYYNPLDFMPEYASLIEDYHITICKTTKDTFTLHLQIPANLIFKEVDTNLTIDLDAEISCINLLPIRLQFEANDIISVILENEYVEKYLSSTVDVKQAKLSVDMKLKYDSFEVTELLEEEKSAYKEYVISN